MIVVRSVDKCSLKFGYVFDGKNYNFFESEKENEDFFKANNKVTIEQLNAQQFEELQPTDWYFVRKVELDIDVPSEVIEARLAIRLKYDNLKNAL